MGWIIFIVVVLMIIGAAGKSTEAKKKQEAVDEAARRQKEAEDYILKSGDQEAIKMMMLARANPSNYTQVMAAGAGKGNSTLKVDLSEISEGISSSVIETASSDFDLSEWL